MSKKIDRALYGPSWTEVTIGALLSVLIGLALCAVWLTSKPVETVREMPKEPVSGMVYHIEGSANATKGRQWESDRKMLIAGKSITLTEDELNTAVKTLTTDAAKVAIANKTEEKPAVKMINPGTLNFRIQDSMLQIGAPVELNYYGIATKVQVVAQGTFERSGDKFAYAPTKFYVGSCPIVRLPVIGEKILDLILANAPIPAELIEAWGKLANVTIEGSELKLAMP
jgi:hypothetical protein